MECVLPRLPEELMVEILLRLPVKSLLRFKCVCKRWLSLIVDPEFGKLHFDLDAAPTDRILNFLMDFQGISLDIEDYDSPPIVFNSPLPTHFLKASQYIRSVQIAGSCRGFILLRIITRFGLIDMVVWNPSTGIQKLINADHLLDKKHSYLCGIGYDSSNDDYVVVVVTLTRSRVEPCVLIDYFSLRNNSWCLNQRIAAPYCWLGGVLYPDGQLLNGALHWLVEVPDSSCVIIAFHVREKRLSEIPLPLIDLPVGSRYQIYHMRVMRGCLTFCLFHAMGNGTIVYEMWTMKEYKVQSSWFKSFVCSTSGVCGFGFFFPLFLTKNGEILGLKRTIALARFNDKGESLEYPPHGNYWTRSSLVHGVYRESLLSLPGQL